MKRKLLTVVCSLLVGQIYAQGVWKDLTTTSWNYSLTGVRTIPGTNPTGVTYTPESIVTATNASTTTITSSDANPTKINSWLPRPDTAIAYLRIGSAQESITSLDLASTTKSISVGLLNGSVNKFSVYDNRKAKSIAKYAFKVKFSSPSSGFVRLVLGNNTAPTSLFTSSSNVGLATNVNIFAGFQFGFAAGSDIAFTYRKKTTSASAVYESISADAF